MSKKVTVSNLLKMKEQNDKISMITCYDYSFAKIFDNAGVDVLLVGDSLGMVVLGYEDTTKVTMEDMIHHIKAVVRGNNRSLVIGDMPFLSYHIGDDIAVKNAGRLVTQGGCTAVKMEGGIEIVSSIKRIINAGIPVMGHLGYTPQSVNVFGGHKVIGKTLNSAKKLIEDALALQDAGVFGIVLECVPYKLSEYITKKLTIPTIGIGSGVGCDGQVLVSYDMLGIFKNFIPKHVKQYMDLNNYIDESTRNYINDIKNKKFPNSTNSFDIDENILNEVIN